MNKASVRDLHLNTSSILKRVAEGVPFIIEKGAYRWPSCAHYKAEILLPVSEGLLYRLEAFLKTLHSDVYLRAGDGIHLITAREAGFAEVWSNDRHLLRAAPHFGLNGKAAS